MAGLWRWTLVLALLVSAGPRLAASPTEKGAFNAAAEAFRDGFFPQAEQGFAQFVLQFTNSARIPEAILFQAQARLRQNNYAGAVELLTAQEAQAGKLAEEYVFWLAEAHQRKGDDAAAADTFARLIAQFPASPRGLESAIGEAGARARLSDWPRIIASLQKPDSTFQTALKSGATNTLAARGLLLLGEAQFNAGDYAGTEKTLEPLARFALTPEMAWQRQYLLCRTLIATGRTEDALRNATNLPALAVRAGSPSFQAESASFQAGILERLQRPNEAIALYSLNLKDGVPAQKQGEALLKVTELFLAQDRISEAAQTLERFCTNHPAATNADFALLSLGELRLRQYAATLGAPSSSNPTNAAAATNYLRQATVALSSLVKNHPQSGLMGEAQLNLGWCLWFENQLPESQAAFAAAIAKLSPSFDLATAHFKLGDTQSRQNDFASAITNYAAVVDQFGSMPEVKKNLVEPALYQMVRAALAGGNLAAATNALGRILALFPSGFHADRAVLLTGQAMTRQGDPAAARDVFAKFAQLSPDSPLMPDVRLALARTYERENKWLEAIQEYDGWLERYTNSPAKPRAEYFRGWANYQARRESTALTCFTNFVARYPDNELVPLARWWVADYNFRLGVPGVVEAEKNYELISQSTNLPVADLGYQARLMSGRAAVVRQGWTDAIRYFTNLTSDLNCPADIRLQAMFAYGDTLMAKDSTNKLADYEEAIRVFSKLAADYPTNRLAVLALGQKANCLLQWADADAGTNAYKAFEEVIAAPAADFTARCIATVGLGAVLEKQARTKTGAEQATLYEQALGHYLDAFYYEKLLREGERPDVFWVKRAGLDAARVAEAQQKWEQAINVYQRLQKLLPTLSGSLEKRILKAQESMTRSKQG